MTEKPDWEIKKEIKAKAIEKAKQVFREAGLQVTIDGCGCCDSPGLRLVRNGEVIFDDGNANLNTEEIDGTENT